MGFMAGLGKGFSQSFNTAANNRAAREQDAFRVAYQEYTDKKAQYEAEETKWNDNLKKGEAIAAKYGAPPEAGLKAAEWLSAGFSDAYVDDLVANSKFSATPDPVAASDANNLEAVDAQMEESGMSPEVPMEAGSVNDPVQAPVPEVQQDTDILGGMFGPDGIFKNAGKSDMQQAQGAVMDAGGISQEKFDQVNTGYTPPDTSGIQVDTAHPAAHPLAEFGMEDGVTKAKFIAADAAAKEWAKSDNPADQARAARWEAIRPDLELATAEDVDPTLKAEYLRLLGASATQRQKLAQANADITTAAQTGMELAEMAKASDGKVLTSVSGGVSFLEGLKTEAGAVLDLIGSMGAQGQDEQSVLSSAMKELENRVANGEMTAEMAQQYREFTAKSIRYIFAVGRALGTEGNGFSNKDYENIRNAILTSNNADAFSNNLKELASEQVRSADNLAGQLSNTAEILVLEQEAPELFTSVQKSLVPLSEQLKTTPVGQWITSPRQKATDPITNPTAETPSVPTYAPGDQVIAKDGKTYVFLGGDYKDQSRWQVKNASGK